MASLKVKEILCLLYSGILFVSGAILVGFAIVLCYKCFYHFKFVPSESLGPFLIILLVGIAHCSISWVGVKGPSSEHDFFILMFVIFTLILLVIELTIGIWSIILWYDVGDKSLELMKESQLGYFKTAYHKEEWDLLESKLNCCGLNGTQDYINAKQPIPLSCLKCTDKEVFAKNKICTEFYQTGCSSPLKKYAENLLLQASLTGFLSGIYQMAGVAAFIIYYRALKEERATRAAARASRFRQSLGLQRRPNSTDNNTAPTAPT